MKRVEFSDDMTRAISLHDLFGTWDCFRVNHMELNGNTLVLALSGMGSIKTKEIADRYLNGEDVWLMT